MPEVPDKPPPFRGVITTESYETDPVHRQIADNIRAQLGLREERQLNRIVIGDHNEGIDVEYFMPGKVGEAPQMRTIHIDYAKDSE